MKTQVDITANNKTDAAFNSFIKNINSAENNIRGFNGSLSSIAGGFKNMLSNVPFMLTAAATTAATTFGIMIKNAIDTADEYYKLSQQINLSVESLSTMSYAVKLSGLTMQEFSDAMLKFNKYIAANGDTTKTVEQNLFDLADKFSNTADGIKKTTIATEAFGRTTGAKMIPLLNMGADGFQEAQQRARDFGLEISTNTAMAAERLNDSVESLKLQLQGVATSTLPTVIGLLQEMVLTLTVADKLFMAAFTSTNMMDMAARIGSVMATARIEMELQIGALKKQREVELKLAEEQRKEEAARIKAAQAAERLKQQWEQTSKKFQEDIAKNIGKTETFEYQFLQLTNRVKELKYQFGDKKEIDLWFESMSNNLAKFGETSIKSDKVKLNIPDNLDFAVYDLEKQKIAEVTDFELANYMVRQEAFTGMFDNMIQASQTFYQLSGQKSKEWFAIFKSISIAEAVISGYNSILNSYEEGTKWGGPILGTVFAAAAAAFTAAKIASIAATNPGTSSMGGGGASAPSIPNPNSLRGGEAEGGKGNITINVYGSIVDHGKFAREILPALEDAYSDLGGG